MGLRIQHRITTKKTHCVVREVIILVSKTYISTGIDFPANFSKVAAFLSSGSHMSTIKAHRLPTSNVHLSQSVYKKFHSKVCCSGQGNETFTQICTYMAFGGGHCLVLFTGAALVCSHWIKSIYACLQHYLIYSGHHTLLRPF